MKNCILLIVMLFMISCDSPKKVLTIERQNIIKRFNQESVSKSIKHLYVISTSGEVIIYSTVKGKVTNSKRAITTPNIIVGTGFQVEFLYWWDSKDRYHKHYILGDQIIHISDSPLPVKNILINMEDEL